MATSGDPAFLHGLVRKEARCLLQYVGDAFPWTSARDFGKRDALLLMSRREREALDRVIRACIKAKTGNPVLGAYAERFMDLNFLAIDYLIPRLLEDQERRVKELEWAVLTVPEFAREPLHELLRVKREDLAMLRELAAPQAPAA